MKDNNRLLRRSFLALAGSVATVGLAGCTDQVPFIGSNSPENVIQEFWEATDDQDSEQLDEITHSMSPARPEITDLDDSPDVDIEVESINVTEEHDEQAFVDSTVRQSLEGESVTETTSFELRTENDEWKLWDIVE